MRARAEKKTKTKTNNSKTLAKFTKPTKPNTPIKQKQKQIWNSETDIEVGRVSFDAEFEVLGLNLAIELLGMNVWWKIYVHVHFLQSLVPFEHLLTWTNKIKTGKMKIRNMVSVAQTTVNWWERERERERERPLWMKLCRFSGANFSAIFFPLGFCFFVSRGFADLLV